MITKDFKNCKRHNSPQIEDSNMDEDIIRSDQKKHKKMIKEESKQILHFNNQVEELTEDLRHLNINDIKDGNDINTLYPAQKSQVINSPIRNQMESSISKQYCPSEQQIKKWVKKNQNEEDFCLIEEYDNFF